MMCDSRPCMTSRPSMLDVSVRALAFSPAGDLAVASGSEVHLVADKTTLQRFSPTGEKIGKQLPIDRAYRLAVCGDELVLGGETTWLAALDGTTLRTLDETICDPNALAVFGDRIAIGGERGLRVVSRQ